MSSIRLNWKSAANATAYQVWRHTADVSGSATMIADDVTGLHYTDTTVTAGATYYYWIKAKNALGTGGFGPSSGAITASNLLSAPAELVATLLTVTDINLTWAAVAGATRYDVYRHTSEDSSAATLLAADVATESYTDSTGTEDTPYFYWVKAKDAGASVSAFSASAMGFAAIAAPAVPSGLSASDTEPGQVTVAWSASARANSYLVFRNTANDSATATQITEVLGTSFVDTSVADATTYYYWVKARNYTGTSAFSTGDAGTPTVPVPDAPDNVVATRGVGKVTVTADTVPTATSYSVWRNTSNTSGGALSIASGLSTPFFEDTSGTPETTYYYWVKATNTTGTGAFSASASAASQIPAPTGMAATTNIVGKSTVSWSAVTHADSYEVWRNTTNNSGTATQIASGLTATSYDDTTVVKGQTYYYWTKAVKTGTPSPFSSPTTGATAVPPSPTGVSASSTLTDRITISWAAVVGASGYEVFFNTVDNFLSATSLTTVVPPQVSVEHFGTSPGAVYFYWVVATVSGIASNPSSSDSGFVVGSPSAPTGVTASEGNVATVAVSWDSVVGAATYSVFRGFSSSPVGLVLLASGITGTSFSDDAPSSTAAFYYFVTATNAAGTSGYSTPDSGYASAPAAPSSISASESDPDEVQVTWSAVTGADSYKVYRNTTNSSGGASFLGDVFTTSFDDSSATVGVTYYYWVKAVKNTLSSPFSSSDTGTRISSIPAAPTGVSATDTSGEAIGITATPSAGATSYSVWRNTTNNSGTATQIASGLSTPAYDDYGATPEVTYYYWMKATNSSGTSSFSSPDTGYRPAVAPLPPASVTATDGTEGDKIVVSWDASAGATGYEIWRGTTSSSGSASLLTTVGAVTSYDDESPTTSDLWYYWIKAIGPGGTSAFAPVSSSESGYAVPPAQPGPPSTTLDVVAYVRITWSPVAHANHYSVWRNTTNNFGTAVEVETNNTALLFDDESAPFDQNLYYWIVAHNDIGPGSESFSSVGYSPGTIPAVPTLVNQYGASGLVFTQWNAAALASSYEIIACNTDDISDVFGQESMGAGLTYNYVTGVNGVTLWIAIRSVNRFGESAWTTLVPVFVF